MITEQIEARGQLFSVEMTEAEGRYAGNVYPISEWERPWTGEKGWAYESQTSGGDTHEHLNSDCRILFEFSFCWRGVWEGRIYFKDEEYWGEELSTMSALWDKMQPLLKEKIRQSRPNEQFND